jgi:protein PhnA
MDLTALTPVLMIRADDRCELCLAMKDLAPVAVPPVSEATLDRAVLVCAVCRAWLGGDAPPAGHAFCLQESAWCAEPAVQVVAWRLLRGMSGESWAQDLADQLYMDDGTAAWARAGQDEEPLVATVDSNGTVLADGDSVTLIKDLDVKGAGFTAKRGTLVKNIRLTENPEHVEGRVNKVAIVLVARFLKRVG